MAQPAEVGATTLALLETRLQRVNFALTGEAALSDNGSSNPLASSPAATRMRALEQQLRTLSTRCEIASEVLALHAKHPHVFHPAATNSALESDMPIPALAAIVLSHQQLYRRLATQLDACKSRTLPDASTLVPLFNLREQIARVAAKQDEQDRELAQLRTRSAQVLEKWYTEGVLDMSERWADWEERLKDVEILVKRTEAAKRRDEDLV